MKVTLQELRAAASRLFEHCESTGRTEWDLVSDYYWEVPSEALYRPEVAPTELTIGQLTSDLDLLRRLVRGDPDCPPVGAALAWLASILRYVGHRDPC